MLPDPPTGGPPLWSASRIPFSKFLNPPQLIVCRWALCFKFQVWTIAFGLYLDTTPPQKLCSGSAGMEKRLWKAQRTTRQDLRLFLKTNGSKSKMKPPQHTPGGLIVAWLSPITAAHHRMSTQSPRPVAPSGEVRFDIGFSIGFSRNLLDNF